VTILGLNINYWLLAIAVAQLLYAALTYHTDRRRMETAKEQPRRPLMIIGALMLLTWVAVGFNYFGMRERAPNELSPLVDFWGFTRPSTFSMIVETSKLVEFQNNDRLVLILRAIHPDVDRMTDVAISKSTAYTITGAPLSLAVYKPLLRLNPGVENYVEFNLVLLPIQFSPEQITTLSDVERLGGKILADPAANYMQAPLVQSTPGGNAVPIAPSPKADN